MLFSFLLSSNIVGISSDKLKGLLHDQVQLIKYKEINQHKSAEIKRLQDQVSYYKKQTYKRTKVGCAHCSKNDTETPNLANVIHNNL